MASDTNAPAPSNTDPLAGPRREALIAVFGEKFAASYLGPIHFIDNATLQSPAAVNFYRRDFEFISKVLNYEYQYRSWNGFDQQLLDRYAEIISKKLTSIRTLLENNCNRFTKLLEMNNVRMESTLYSNSVSMTVPITSGHARGYFLLLQELDRLNLLAGTANLMGVIDSSMRANAEFLCKKAVRAFAAALRNEVVRIYREADRMIKEQHGQGNGDAAKSSAVAAHGKELEAFGVAMDTEGKSDRSLDLGGADPSQLIDDAAAAATAVAKTRIKKEKVVDPVATPT